MLSLRQSTQVAQKGEQKKGGESRSQGISPGAMSKAWEGRLGRRRLTSLDDVSVFRGAWADSSFLVPDHGMLKTGV